MGRTKKTSYTENEKKGLSQARNLGTDRLLGKIKEHADITDHKVFVNFIPTWDKGISRVWVSDNWGATAPLRHDGRGNLEAVNGGFPALEHPPRQNHHRDEDSGADLPGSQSLQLKPPATSSNKKDKQKMKTVCEKCFTARSTKDDLFPGVPWLRCGVSGCRKLNIHSSCSYIKLVNCDEKNVTNFCKTFVRCVSHFGEIVDSNSESESDSDFELKKAKPKQVRRSKPMARAVKTPGSFLLENDLFNMDDMDVSEDNLALNQEDQLEIINMTNMDNSSNDPNPSPWANFHPALGEYTPGDTNSQPGVTVSCIQKSKNGKNIFSVPRKPLNISADQLNRAGSGVGAGNTSGHGQWTSSGHVQWPGSGHGQWSSSGQGLGTSSGQGPGTSYAQGLGTSSGLGKETSSGQGKRTSSGQGKGTGTSSRQGKGTSSGQRKVDSSSQGHKLKPVSSARDDSKSVLALEGNKSGLLSSAGKKKKFGLVNSVEKKKKLVPAVSTGQGHKLGSHTRAEKVGPITSNEQENKLGLSSSSALVGKGEGMCLSTRAVGPGPSTGQHNNQDGRAGSGKADKRKVKPAVLNLKKKPKLIE